MIEGLSYGISIGEAIEKKDFEYIKVHEFNEDQESSSTSSAFGDMQSAPELEQFHKNYKYIQDKFPSKVNLTIGAYRDENGDPFVFPVVQKAKKQLLNEGGTWANVGPHNFGPFGYDPFIQATIELLLGSDSAAIQEKRVLGVQCLSGTGALRLGAEFLHQCLAKKTIHFSDPTWNGHECIFRGGGFRNLKKYRYYDCKKHRMEFDGMLEDIKENTRENDVILLQACSHNPTGLDLSKEQWKKVAKIVKERNLIPFFDIAYAGFASGDPEEDAWAIRHFADQGMDMLIAQSFAKNFGLYNERIGTLTFVFSESNAETLKNVRSRLVPIINGLWANPPLHGAKIVEEVLRNGEFCNEWLETLKKMSKRLKTIRLELRAALDKQSHEVMDGEEEGGGNSLSHSSSWANLTEQTGFFSYTGLTASQVEFLEQNFHIYMLADGRINVCGLNQQNVPIVAQAFGRAISAKLADHEDEDMIHNKNKQNN